MTQADQDRIFGEACRNLKQYEAEKEKLHQEARVLGVKLEDAGRALQVNPAVLAFSDESDFPANLQYDARIERSIFNAADLAGLLQRIRINRDNIKRTKLIVGEK